MADSGAPGCTASAYRALRSSFSYLITSVSGLVVKSIVAIDGPRVRFAADASCFLFSFLFLLALLFCLRLPGLKQLY